MSKLVQMPAARVAWERPIGQRVTVTTADGSTVTGVLSDCRTAPDGSGIQVFLAGRVVWLDLDATVTLGDLDVLGGHPATGGAR